MQASEQMNVIATVAALPKTGSNQKLNLIMKKYISHLMALVAIGALTLTSCVAPPTTTHVYLPPEKPAPRPTAKPKPKPKTVYKPAPKPKTPSPSEFRVVNDYD